VTEPEPSWWKYIASSDADKSWSAFYASMALKGGQFSERDHDFYLNAIQRLAEDSYTKPAHRPPDAVNFWLTCHYQLGILSAKPKAAASITAWLASTAGIEKGHTPKAIQRHAKKLETPAKEFLDACRRAVMERAPERPSNEQLNHALIKWIERMVRKVA
jgi:hypothetical protein